MALTLGQVATLIFEYSYRAVNAYVYSTVINYDCICDVDTMGAGIYSFPIEFWGVKARDKGVILSIY